MMIDPNHEMLKPFEMTPLEESFMSVFWQLNRDRTFTMMGEPKRLTLQTFVYYQQLFDDVLNTDEIRVLQAIDDAYLSTHKELNED